MRFMPASQDHNGPIREGFVIGHSMTADDRSCCDTTQSHGRLVSYEGFDSGPYRTHRRKPKFPLYPHSPPSEILLMADAQSPLEPGGFRGGGGGSDLAVQRGGAVPGGLVR